ncbi:putative UDP-Gal or UDP-GlcNAc-dependent glycosyltransferase [Trypanosoma grayi]|uniref:putative UDP-Gal or UDP-GlcNAc-dependent glycosyltransferase n=1 Tax=Trypanosoma grayi TaxID=71804 RepID=UPI0004F45C6C|nr:putative UDP-Gal or UDP-GlcNAc-dependent glycosyltransferase [Trypanosoma grayi]KEG05467.1 putative UDP-Gal or UDP-GlcNAc-dependent glycosyltransferase [Trypanosoma grayi]
MGMCFTLARDVVQQLVLFEPVRRLVYSPYTKQRLNGYRFYNTQHDDVMVGQELRLEVRYPALVAVEDCRSRFHNAHNGEGRLLVMPVSFFFFMCHMKINTSL